MRLRRPARNRRATSRVEPDANWRTITEYDVAGVERPFRDVIQPRMREYHVLPYDALIAALVALEARVHER